MLLMLYHLKIAPSIKLFETSWDQFISKQTGLVTIGPPIAFRLHIGIEIENKHVDQKSAPKNTIEHDNKKLGSWGTALCKSWLNSPPKFPSNEMRNGSSKETKVACMFSLSLYNKKRLVHPTMC